MAINMKANGKMIIEMDLGHFHGLIMINMSDNGKIIKYGE